MLRGCVPKKILVYGAALGGELEVSLSSSEEITFLAHYILFGLKVKTRSSACLVYSFSSVIDSGVNEKKVCGKCL